MKARRPKIQADTAPPERWQHAECEVVKTIVAGVERQQVKAPHALEMYRDRKQLAPKDPGENARRYDAGCKLREQWDAAGLEPRLIGRYSDMVSGNGVQILVQRVGAYQAWKRAVQAIGPIASNEVVGVCCLGETLGSRERLEILRRGLAVLADHYGIS